MVILCAIVIPTICVILSRLRILPNFSSRLKYAGRWYLLWDMKDPSIPDVPRDASAAALVASAFMNCKHTWVQNSVSSILHMRINSQFANRPLSGTCWKQSGIPFTPFYR